MWRNLVQFHRPTSTAVTLGVARQTLAVRYTRMLSTVAVKDDTYAKRRRWALLSQAGAVALALGTASAVKADEAKANTDNDDEVEFTTEGELEKQRKSQRFNIRKFLNLFFGPPRRDESESETGEKQPSKAAEIVRKVKKAVGLEPNPSLRPRVTESRNFRENKIYEYEDRLRRYSAPEKIFRYFATLSCDGSVYMTVDDFMRSIVRGELQPEGLGLDQYAKLSPKEMENVECKFHFTCFGKDVKGAIISFPEYLFLLSLLLIPLRNFELAFRMFDLDQNGLLDLEEFKTVFTILLKQSHFGKMQKSAPGQDHFDDVSNSFLLRSLFGKKGDKKLTLERFREFFTQFKDEVHSLEYFHMCGDTEHLSEHKFATALTHNIKNKNVHERLLERADEVMARDRYVSLQDWLLFRQLSVSVDQLEDAMKIYAAAGHSIDPDTFARACAAVLNETPLSTSSNTPPVVSRSLIDLVFKIFDLDNDGHLSWRELATALRADTAFGMTQTRDMGLWRGMKGLIYCAKARMNMELD